MKILTAKEIKTAEALCFKKYFSEAELMAKAGEECALKIIKYFKEEISDGKISVFCGNGKNAGDGFVIARLLKKSGFSPEIVLVDKEPEIVEPLEYYRQAVSSDVPVIHLEEFNDDCALIVDCIFGIGFHGEPREPFGSAISIINSSCAKVVSVDTPSGTDATTGEAINAVCADLTIAVSTYKYCHVLPPANACCGKTVSVNIGIPEDCWTGSYASTISRSEVKKCFTERKYNSHKGDCGHLLNLCGSFDMPGAAVICAMAALKSGVGLLKCTFPKSIYPVMTSHLIQPLFSSVSENESKTFSIGGLTHILKDVAWADSIALGCGIGNNDDTQVIVNQVIRESEVPIVLDADGINSILLNIDVLREAKAKLVLTPHPAEMARLINESADYVQKNRIEVAKAFAKEYGAIVVLKGANTVVTDGKAVFVNTTGNPGLAMGGTGDMLTGMIASFISQGILPFDAAKAAVYIHGLCADITAKEISVRGMTIENMLELLGALMSEFE